MDANNNQGGPSLRRACKYDVFISFRGPDTRNSFVDHLYNHLIKKGIFVFKDDERLEIGESISSQLVQAIKDSRVSLVVFSRKYAESKWCLDELAIIAECKRESEQKVFPIFYEVDPSHVRYQSGVYENAFDSHADEFVDNPGKVGRWRSAMRELGNLAGWDIRIGKEYGIIESIVQKVIDVLHHKFSGLTDDLIGILSRVEELEKLLNLSSEDGSSQVLGILGMGGIGKTTHANVLYDRISYQFSACCFIEDVNQIYRTGGTTAVQKQILLQTLDEKNLETYSPPKISEIIRNRLYNMKVLVVLDNIDDSEQFTKLRIKPEFLGAGSRIIITTRDEHILEVCGAHEFYNVPLLSNAEARELFWSRAFKRFYPNNNCEELIPDILKYAQCLPLAIEVLGSFLGPKNDTQWKEALKRLRRNDANDKIMDVLQLSYDGLENIEKEIFLHIACFFKGERVDYVTRILDCCELTPGIGIRVIEQKSLITIRNDEIHMHEMLEDLGKNIVKRHFPTKKGSWSRLWLYEDFHHVMKSQTGTENIEAIVLDQKADVSKHSVLDAEEFSRMVNLKLLILHHQNFSRNLNFLSNSLHYLTWHGYPFTSLPPKFEPDSLVELNMPNSNINRLWEGIKHLPNLKRMDLSNSKYLEETPNFEKMQSLERLDLTGCTNLLLVHSSISRLRLLAFLSLQNCCSLVNLDLYGDEEYTLINAEKMQIPLCELVSLKVLHLSGCTKLEKTPDFMELSSLEYLDFGLCTSLSTIHESIGHLKMLKYLSFRGCTNLERMPFGVVGNMTSLQTLDLRGCLKLRINIPLELKVMSFSNLESLIVLDLGLCNLIAIPDAIGELRCVERLNLEGNKFVSLPSSMKNLFSLAYLNLAHCHKLQSLPELPAKHDSSGGKYFKMVSGSRNHRSGLYMFDCPNIICRNDEIQAQAWSSFTLPRLFRLIQAPGYFRCGFDIVVPGSILFQWFNDQFEGDSIITIADSDVLDNDWIGFAFFASFKTNGHPSTSGSSHNSFSSHLPHPLYLSFETEQAEETFNMPLCFDQGKIGSSVHHWLIYISRPHCHFVNSGAHITFKAHPDFEITKWGLRMVFKQDANVKLGLYQGKRSKGIATDSPVDHISFNHVHENRGSSVPKKVQLPYNWFVTDDEEYENIEAKNKENNLSNVGLTTSHRQKHTASGSRRSRLQMSQAQMGDTDDPNFYRSPTSFSFSEDLERSPLVSLQTQLTGLRPEYIHPTEHVVSRTSPSSSSIINPPGEGYTYLFRPVSTINTGLSSKDKEDLRRWIESLKYC